MLRFCLKQLQYGVARCRDPTSTRKKKHADQKKGKKELTRTGADQTGFHSPFRLVVIQRLEENHE